MRKRYLKGISTSRNIALQDVIQLLWLEYHIGIYLIVLNGLSNLQITDAYRLRLLNRVVT